METAKEKIAYLRGIIDGDSSLKEERIRFLFEKVLEILDELAAEVDELAEAQDELDDYLQEIDFDLAYLEDELVDEDDICDDEDWSGWDDEEPGTFVEIPCVHCGYLVSFDEEFLSDPGVQICCPRCDAVVFQTDDYDDQEEPPESSDFGEDV